MPFSTAAKNSMLNALEPDGVRLHSGDPGSAGTSNALGSGNESATFDAAANGERALTSDVTVTGLSAEQSVTHFSVWDDTVFLGSGQITSGDTAANADGEFTLKGTTTKLDLNDS